MSNKKTIKKKPESKVVSIASEENLKPIKNAKKAAKKESSLSLEQRAKNITDNYKQAMQALTQARNEEARLRPIVSELKGALDLINALLEDKTK
jgi:hypothetical protein